MTVFPGDVVIEGVTVSGGDVTPSRRRKLAALAPRVLDMTPDRIVARWGPHTS